MKDLEQVKVAIEEISNKTVFSDYEMFSEEIILRNMRDFEATNNPVAKQCYLNDIKFRLNDAFGYDFKMSYE